MENTQPKAGLMEWLDKRFGLKPVLRSIVNHEVPEHVNWLYCFGGLTLFFFTILAITGAILALYYKPVPEQAYQSLDFIAYKLPLGWLVRSVHRWAADGMVITVLVHMLRVFFTGSYKDPRELNWVVGVFLLLLTLAFAVTGFLLPWDQHAYWATNELMQLVSGLPLFGGWLANLLRGGPTVGAATLTRFFVSHIFILPALIVIFMAAHFVIIRRQGISGPL